MDSRPILTDHFSPEQIVNYTQAKETFYFCSESRQICKYNIATIIHDYQMPNINVILSLIRTSYTRKRYFFSSYYFFKLYFFIIFYLLYFSAYSENDAFVCLILAHVHYTVPMLG